MDIKKNIKYEYKPIHRIILNETYLYLFENVINCKIGIDINYIYMSFIPYLIDENEINLINFDYNEYKIYITQKIDDFFINMDKYKCCVNIFNIIKLCNVMNKMNAHYNYVSTIVFNELVDKIKYVVPDNLFLNYTTIKQNNDFYYYFEQTDKSMINQMYNKIPNEIFDKYIFKLLDVEDHNLLSNEFDCFDLTITNDEKFDNIKYNIFTNCLSQYILIDREPLDLTKFFDITNIPNSNSIRFTIFMAWYIAQRVKKNPVPNIILTDINSKINKFYNYFVNLSDEKFWKIYNFINVDERSYYDENDYLDEYTITSIFDEQGDIAKVPYDYVEGMDTSEYELKIINNKYVIMIKDDDVQTDNPIYKELVGGSKYNIINVIPFYKIFSTIKHI